MRSAKTVRALSADDFVIFKSLATRERDPDDARRS